MLRPLACAAHLTRADLVHWAVGGPSTGFGGLTGSVAVTPAGAFAFYPEGSQAGVDMARSIGGTVNLTMWAPQGRVITAPSMAGELSRVREKFGLRRLQT